MKDEDEFRGVGNVVAVPQEDLLSDAWAALSGLPDKVYYLDTHLWYNPAVLWEAAVLSETKEGYTIRYERIFWRELTFVRFERSLDAEKRRHIDDRWDNIRFVDVAAHHSIRKEYLDLRLEDALRRVAAYRAKLGEHLRMILARTREEQEALKTYEDVLQRRIDEVGDVGTWPHD